VRATVERAADACRDGAEPHHATTRAGTPSADPARYALAAVRAGLTERGRSPVEAAVRGLAARARDPAGSETADETSLDEEAPETAREAKPLDDRAPPAPVEQPLRPATDLPDDDARIDAKRGEETAETRLAAARTRIGELRIALADGRDLRPPETRLLTGALAELLGALAGDRVPAATDDVERPFPSRPLDREAGRRPEEDPRGSAAAGRRTAEERVAEAPEARRDEARARETAARNRVQERALARGPLKDKRKALPRVDKKAGPGGKAKPPKTPAPGKEEGGAKVEAPGAGGPSVAAWKGRLDAKVAGVTAAKVPDADRYVVTFQAAADNAPAQTDQRKRELIAEARKAVTPVDQYKKDDFDMPDDPIPEARVKVDKWVNKRIRKQDLPKLEKSPVGSLPELGTATYTDKEGATHVVREIAPGKYAEIHVVAPGEKPPARRPEDEVREAKKLEGKGTLTERLKAHNDKEPRNLKAPAGKSLGANYNDDLPLKAPVMPNLQGIARIDTAKVLEAALVGIDRHAGRILRQAEEAFPGGQGLPPGYTAEWTAEVKSDVVAEFEKIRAAGNAGGKGLKDKLQAERDKVDQEVKAAHDQVKAAKKEGGAGSRTVYEAVGDEIRGLRDELDRQISDEAAIAKGGTEAKEVLASRDRYIKANTDKVETWLGRYEKMRESRKKQLDDSHRDQTFAYRACAELDRKEARARGNLDAGKDKKPDQAEIDATIEAINAWETDVIQGVKGINKKFETLRGDVDVDIDKYVANLKSAGEGYEEACRQWARARLKLERGFFAKLLDAILEWFGLATKEAKVWQVRSEENNSTTLAESELWLAEFQLQHHGELTEAALKEMTHLTEAQRAIAQSFFIDKKGDGAAALAAGLVAGLGTQWRPRLHQRIEQKVLKDSWSVVVAVADATPGFSTTKVVSDLARGFAGPGTKKQVVFDALRGLTAIQVRAVEFQYERTHGVPLRFEIATELNDILDLAFYGSHDRDRALAQLATTKSQSDAWERTPDGRWVRKEGKIDEAEMDAIAVQIDQTMKGTFLHGAGTDEKELLALLRGKTPREIEAIKRAYLVRTGRDLTETIRAELLDGVSAPWQFEEALAWLEHRPDEAEAAAMRGAMGHVRTQGPRSYVIGSVLSGFAGPGVGGAAGALAIDDDTIINLVTRDQKEAEAAFARIEAEASKDAARYGWDDKTYRRQLGIRLKAVDEAFGTNYGGEFNALDPKKSALDVAFAQAFSADQARLLTAIRLQELAIESAARVSIEHKALLPDSAEVNRALADQYARQYAAERRDVEAEWRKKKDKEWEDCTVHQVGTDGQVVKDKHGNPKVDEEKTNEKRREWRKRWVSVEGAYARKKEADAEAERRALAKAPENMRRLKATYEDPSMGFVTGSMFSTGSFEGDVYSATNVSWAGVKDLFGVEARTADTDKTMALLAQSGYLTGGQELFFAVYGAGTNADAVHRAYAGKSPAEIAKMHEDLGKRMAKVGISVGTGPGQWTPEAWVKDDFSGRDLDDVTVEMEFGEAATPDEKVRRAERRVQLEKASRRSGVGDAILGSLLLGPIAGPVAAEGFASLRQGMASTEMAVLEGELARLKAERALLERDKAELAKRGIVEGDAEYYAVINERYDKIALVADSVDSALAAHRAQIDAIADWAAAAIQVVMIAGAFVIGAIVEAVTFGLATPAVVAAWTALITAVTTAALVIAAKVIIKGGAYGWEEFAADVALAVVDAILAYATANVGSTLLKGALLSKLAGSNIVARLAAHGAANTIEGLIQSIPNTLFGALINDDPDLFGILTQIGTAAGISAAVGMKGGVAKPGKFKPGAHGRPTHDILAYRGTPQDRLNAFKAHQKHHPSADLKTFLRDLDTQMLAHHTAAFDDAATQRALRKELLEGLPVPQRRQLAGARIEMMTDADFRRAFGDTADPARLVVRDGRPVVVARAGTDLAVLGKEAPHLFEAAAPKAAAKPVAVESAAPRPRGASASPDPLAPGTQPPPRRVIVEPYTGPRLDSPIDLARQNPGARIVATEATIRPEPAEVQRLADAGGTFIPDNKPGHLPVGSVDDIKMRFPIPHDRAVQQDFARRLAELETMFPNRPRGELLEQAMRDVTHQAESLTAYAPYALERLKPGGTLEVVFWERQILAELGDAGRLRFVDPATGRAYRLELVDLDVAVRGVVAPHSGFGIPGITDATQVHVARFQKVELETRLPSGARGPDVVGQVVGEHSGRPFFPERAGGPIRDLDYGRIRFTERGVDVVEAHVRRFDGGGEMELAMVDRLRRIARGEIPATDFDRAFYSHELREAVRYRRLGLRTGQPLDADEAYRVWNDAHTATLEDYKLRERLKTGQRTLFHPDIVQRFDPSPTGARGPDVGEGVPRGARAAGEPIDPRIRRSVERELRDAGHPVEVVRGLSDEDLLARYAQVQIEQVPQRIAAFRATLDVAARVELDSLQAATHLHHQPVAGSLASRVGTALGTPVRVDPTIPPGEVRVSYKVGPLGNVHGIELHVGAGATLADVLDHIPTLAAYKRYQGLTGVVRRVTDAIERLLAGGGRLRVGSRGHEAWLEIQKLPGIIEGRRLRLAGQPLDILTRLRLEAEIAGLERQLARHVGDLGDVRAGRRYVAAEIVPVDPADLELEVARLVDRGILKSSEESPFRNLRNAVGEDIPGERTLRAVESPNRVDFEFHEHDRFLALIERKGSKNWTSLDDNSPAKQLGETLMVRQRITIDGMELPEYLLANQWSGGRRYTLLLVSTSVDAADHARLAVVISEGRIVRYYPVKAKHIEDFLKVNERAAFDEVLKRTEGNPAAREVELEALYEEARRRYPHKIGSIDEGTLEEGERQLLIPVEGTIPDRPTLRARGAFRD
jgi:hypothetical protein